MVNLVITFRSGKLLNLIQKSDDDAKNMLKKFSYVNFTQLVRIDECTVINPREIEHIVLEHMNELNE